MDKHLSSDTIWASTPAEPFGCLWFRTRHGLAMKNIIDGPQGGQIWFLQTQVAQRFLLDSVQIDSSLSLVVLLAYFGFTLWRA